MAEYALLLSTSSPSLTQYCRSRGWGMRDWVGIFVPVWDEMYFPLKGDANNQVILVLCIVIISQTIFTIIEKEN